MLKGLYIHIPFCRTKCHYCNFISIPDPSPELRRRFFLCLAGEMDRIRKEYGRLQFDTVYFGGGTPSILSAQEMNGLMGGIYGRFLIAPDAEITCEWNPGDGEDEKLAAFKALGVNRISLGAQSFSDKLLDKLGRRHTTHDTLLTIEKIRKAGIENISIDLMLRIPGQTLKDFRDSLTRAVGLEASQISLYDLEVHGETPFGRMQKKGDLTLPGEDEHAAMYQAAIDTLTGAGYDHYEISNFAKPGFASRHNLIYWRNQEYLGLGPGAFSYLDGVRYQFASDSEHYLQKLETGNWRNDVQDELSEEEKETESFMTGLRLREGICPGNFKHIYPALEGKVQGLISEGLLELTEGRIRLTARGKFLSEEVFGFLLAKEPAT